MATLADHLIETSTDKRWPKELREDFVYVAKKLKGAQRFVVSPDVRSSIRSLLSSKPSTLIGAAKFARLPFERCWFEWVPPGDQNIHTNQIQVKRCGALMERYGPHGYTLFTAWEFNRSAMMHDFGGFAEAVNVIPPFGVSSVMGGWDLSSMTLPPIMLAAEDDGKWFQHHPNSPQDLAKLRDDQKNGIRFALKDEKEAEALRLLEQRSAFRVHWETHGHEKILSQEKLTGNINSIVHDVQDEMGHLFATLILMNAKNCVDIAKSEPDEKLNKARRKAGKAELLPYSTVRIELSQSQQRAVDGGWISREEARRHLVRGHFKVRSTGVFWWHDFSRGNAAKGTVERRGHIIEKGELSGFAHLDPSPSTDQ